MSGQDSSLQTTADEERMAIQTANNVSNETNSALKTQILDINDHKAIAWDQHTGKDGTIPSDGKVLSEEPMNLPAVIQIFDSEDHTMYNVSETAEPAAADSEDTFGAVGYRQGQSCPSTIFLLTPIIDFQLLCDNSMLGIHRTAALGTRIFKHQSHTNNLPSPFFNKDRVSPEYSPVSFSYRPMIDAP